MSDFISMLLLTGGPSAVALVLVPEGSEYDELAATEPAGSRGTLLRMALLVPLGPFFGTLGWFYGAQSSVLLGSVMLFAAGGILYLLFQDIAPSRAPEPSQQRCNPVREGAEHGATECRIGCPAR